MPKAHFLCCLLTLLPSLGVSAEFLSTRPLTSIPASRVEQIVPLGTTDSGVRVQIVVGDLGGSTDVSPRQQVILALFREQEMFDVDATFIIENCMRFVSATALPDHRITIVLENIDYLESQQMATVTYILDASNAIKATEAVSTEDQAEKFTTSIPYTRTIK